MATGLSNKEELVAQQLADAAKTKDEWGKAIFNIKEYGIKGDGSGLEVAFQNVVAAVKKVGGGTIFLPPGDYRHSQPILITGINNVSIEGYGARISFAGTSASVNGAINAMSITNSSHISLKGFTIDITNQAQQYSGIKVSTSKHIDFKEVKVSNARWSGISVFDALEGASYDITIERCRVEWCTYGLVTNSNYTRLKNNYISNHWSESIEATSQGSHPIWRGATSTPPYTPDSQYYDAITIKGMGNVVEDNVLVDNGQSGIYTGGLDKTTISNNIIIGNWNKGIDLGPTGTKTTPARVRHIVMKGNIIVDNKSGNVHLNNVDNCIIEGNYIANENISYSDTPTYVVPCIILNNAANNNIIQGNEVVQGYSAVSALFANSAGTKAIGNIFRENICDAAILYNINFDDNLVMDYTNGITNFQGDVKFLRRIKNVVNIDRTGESGFDGRNLLNLNASTDNSFGQITANLPVKLAKTDGAGQDFTVGALTANGATLSGLIFINDAASLKLPRTAQTNSGYLWFDVASGNLKYTSATGVVKTVTAT